MAENKQAENKQAENTLTSNQRDPKVIDGRPFKDFFINMLIRDLQLHDAIADLVDNSVDAARALVEQQIEGTTTPEERLRRFRLDNLMVDLTMSPSEFIIADNCGGMEAEVARNRAFRFGRDPEAAPTPGSVGRFGIGMKRALFKIGRNIHVESIAETSDYVLDINVDDWASPTMQNEWGFKFTTLHESTEATPISHARESRKLSIHITNLNDDVAERFGGPDSTKPKETGFEAELGNKLSSQNLFNINRGLKIRINNSFLNAKTLSLISSKDFNTGQFAETYQVKNENQELIDVQVHIIVGLGDANYAEGGWYVFCNDRLVIGPEQTWVTGWTGTGGDGIAKYHGQFERFRGYVFFTSTDASVLPWTTTKTDLDMDSRLYRSIRLKMIDMAEPVIKFLNQLKTEREGDNPEENWVLNKSVDAAPTVSLVNIVSTPVELRVTEFTAPTAPPRKKPARTEQSVQYHISKTQAEKAKKHLGVGSLREVGKMTFDYYYFNEVEG